ncbi:MAG: DUF1289 domain-containing protein [Alphaproteobacteria bacterium]
MRVAGTRFCPDCGYRYESAVLARKPGAVRPTPTRRISPVPSPCIGICRLIPGTEVCAGCYRTVEEIRDWLGMSDDERRQVNAGLAARSRSYKTS